MMKVITVHELIRVVVLVRWQQLTPMFSGVDIREGSQVKREARCGFQTGQRADRTPLNKTFAKNCYVQVGEFVRLKVGITYSTAWVAAADPFVSFNL